MSSTSDTIRISVVGIGYVGLAIAVLLAQENEVTAIDILPEKVKKINELNPVFCDKDIRAYMEDAKKGAKTLNLKATNDINDCRGSDVIIIATPTDYDPENNFFDCSAVEDVLWQIKRLSADSGMSPIIVIKSTVPIGYTARTREKLNMDNIIYSPEFLRETSALHDCLYPDRIIVGCDEKTKEDARFYAELMKNASVNKDFDLFVMSFDEAEATKLFANTYLALRVSFFNELDSLAEIRGLDSAAVISAVCKDHRIGDYYNNPSFGYGGYCLPKDTKQLLANYEDVPERLIHAIVDSNRIRKEFIAERIIEKANSYCSLAEATIGVFRMSMKTDSDNFRCSSILDIMDILRTRRIRMIIYEPNLENGSEYCGSRIVNDIADFKRMSTCVIANRYDHVLDDIRNKVYTRDLFMRE
jgi:UDPglucose 6-dehydrogenase